MLRKPIEIGSFSTETYRMDDFKAPESSAFRSALERLAGHLPRGYLALLRSHYAAPGHTITATELAQAVGYQNHSAANLHYGRLASLLKSELNWSTGRSVGLKLLVTFVDPGEQNNTEILWVMRRELVEALEQLQWVTPRAVRST